MADSGTKDALMRAGRRAGFHLIQAMIESLKAVEAVIEEIGGIREIGDNDERDTPGVERIEIE